MDTLQYVTKRSGMRQEFDAEKLRNSLRRSGAMPERADQIVEAIAGSGVDGMSTKEIYRRAYKMLRHQSGPVASRYSLKKALIELGPSGFPFEVFIGKLLERDGLKVETGQFLRGKCIQHEVDVLAINEQRLVLGECKFHNSQGMECDVKVPLYIHSRFNDLVSGFELDGLYPEQKAECWIFTNTRFTEDASMYARCSGIKIVSWSEPQGNSLREWVDRNHLHPVTCLSTLTRYEKKILLEEKIVLARDVRRFPTVLEHAHLSAARIQKVMDEIDQLCPESIGA